MKLSSDLCHDRNIPVVVLMLFVGLIFILCGRVTDVSQGPYRLKEITPGVENLELDEPRSWPADSEPLSFRPHLDRLPPTDERADVRNLRAAATEGPPKIQRCLRARHKSDQVLRRLTQRLVRGY
ncbi:MAG: hypothetical protein ACREQ5_07180 [Candidatus Dormibacteria bacterium]